jgi:antitoxin component YwqK of YwqJK toxin-antitoxin module
MPGEKMKNKILIRLLVATVALITSVQTVEAQDRLPGYKYLEEKGQGIKESKRIEIYDPEGHLVGLEVHLQRGGKLHKVYRVDGTLQTSHESYANGSTRERIEYDNSGTTVTERQMYFPDGKLWWESTRKPDGNTIRKDYDSDGNLRSVKELFDNNGFVNTSYRKDGTKWYGSERKSGSKGRGCHLYFSADGQRSLRRSIEDDRMTVIVYDAKGKELYSQEWTRAGREFTLKSVKEPLADTGESRLIKVSHGTVSGVDYLDASGSISRTESPSSISTPVDDSRLKELADDDPTIPRIAITR